MCNITSSPSLMFYWVYFYVVPSEEGTCKREHANQSDQIEIVKTESESAISKKMTQQVFVALLFSANNTKRSARLL